MRVCGRPSTVTLGMYIGIQDKQENVILRQGRGVRFGKASSVVVDWNLAPEYLINLIVLL